MGTITSCKKQQTNQQPVWEKVVCSVSKWTAQPLQMPLNKVWKWSLALNAINLETQGSSLPLCWHWACLWNNCTLLYCCSLFNFSVLNFVSGNLCWHCFTTWHEHTTSHFFGAPAAWLAYLCQWAPAACPGFLLFTFGPKTSFEFS